MRRTTCASSVAAAALASGASPPTSTVATLDSASTARSRPTVSTVRSLVDTCARSSAPVVSPTPRFTTKRSLGSGRTPTATAASEHHDAACFSTASAVAARPATPSTSRHASSAAAAVSSSSSRRIAWNKRRSAGAATASIHARAPSPSTSRRSVDHTASRTAAMGCAANGKRLGTTSASLLPGPAGGTAWVSERAYSAEMRRMMGTFDGDVSRSGSSRRASKPHKPARRGGKSGCEGRCAAAG